MKQGLPEKMPKGLPKDEVLFVADLYGCIITSYNDMAFWRYAGAQEKKNMKISPGVPLPKPQYIGRALRLKRDEKEIESLENPNEKAVYQILSRNLAKIPTGRMLRYSRIFTVSNIHANMPVVYGMSKHDNLYKCIMSTGIDQLIKTFLDFMYIDLHAKLGSSVFSADEIIANRFLYDENRENITGIKMPLDVYGNKDEHLGNLAEKLKTNLEDTFYLGDSERDVKCLEMVGYPIISNLASDDIKEYFREKENAYIVGSTTLESMYSGLDDYISEKIQTVLERRKHSHIKT